MRLAAAAYPIDWYNRWNEYVGKLRVWVRTAAEGGAELLVFPELAALELATLADEENAADPARATDALTARIKDVDDLHASLAREFGAHILAASGPLRQSDGRVLNRARLFAPDGGRGAADQMAPDEEMREVWGVTPGAAARVFDTTLGRIGALVGADAGSPELAAAMAAAGARLLLSPVRAATAEHAEALRQAAADRARETGATVVQAVVVGEAEWSPAIARSTGAAAILAPPAPGGEADGLLAAGKRDAPGWVHAEADASGAAPSAPAADGFEVEVVELSSGPA